MATLHGKFLKYTLLPGFLPRLRELFSSGFMHIAYCIALVYQAVRLLPPDHPYLNPANFGRFGIRHVIGEAANNLVLNRKNIDQIIVFFVILAGMVLLCSQFILFIIAIFAYQPSFAAAVTPIIPTMQNILGLNSIYGHGGTNPDQDIAFIILDRVFGIQNAAGTGGFFGSCISTPAICTDLNNNPVSEPSAFPTAFQTSLHTLFRFYSLGIFMVSVIVILYFITTIVGETAVTGSPFGQRFNKTWAPVRLILFFALLVPLNIGGVNQGLNGAQLLTFWVAKLGSNFATNAWGRFNDTLTGTYLGQASDLVATTNFPEVNSLVRFMFVAKTCKIAEERAYRSNPEVNGTDYEPDGIQAYLVRDANSRASMGGPDARDLSTTSYAQAQQFSNNGGIEIRFGVMNPNDNALEKGYVKPFCGVITIPVRSLDTPAAGLSGAYGVQQVYYEMIRGLWTDPQITQHASCLRDRIMQLDHGPGCAAWPDYNFTDSTVTTWQNYLQTNLPPLVNQQVANSEWGVSARLRSAGWAGAAIWYNRIAEINGDLSTAIANIPVGDKFPYLMEAVALQNRANNANLSPDDMYDPALGKGLEVDYPRHSDRMIAAVLYKAYSLWTQTNMTRSQGRRETDNGFINIVTAFFGVEGIYSIRENPNIHPLAALSALGKSMMDAAVRNIAVGIAGGALGNVKFEGAPLVKAIASLMLTMGKATLAMSFVLYYVLPMLPFIYFMFAVSGWIKSIFEAIVAMPIWALAHISRLDGQGIPGPGANNGYFLLLEIFLRPILILFGLLASISIFAASVNILNEIYDLVVANLTGFSGKSEATGVGPSMIQYYRGPIDQLFFSIVYVVICYMMAMGYFKMVDQVPNNILRWMGVSVSTFGEAVGDPAGQLTSRVYKGGQLATQQLSGGMLATLF